MTFKRFSVPLLAALLMAVGLPATVSASTSDLSNFTSHCALHADGTSVVSGSFDLATAEPTSLQEKGWQESWYGNKRYVRETYFGPAWTVQPRGLGTHYTFTFPTVSAYLTKARMTQGAVLHLDAASFKSPQGYPVTLVFYTGACA